SAAAAVEPRLDPDQHESREQPRPELVQGRRPRAAARPGRALGQAVRRDHCERKPMKRDPLDVVESPEPVGNESHYHSKTARLFAGAIAGQYNLKDERKRRPARPRGRRARALRSTAGPQTFSRHYVEPKDGITQTLHIHLEEWGPGAKSQKHGHVNEAAFYILDGRGYEVHDGIRYDWQAGDIAVVHHNCVHQHFNADPDRPARALVLKSKPMFLFLNMLFQKTVEPRPTEPAPGAENFRVREHEDDYNHAE